MSTEVTGNMWVVECTELPALDGKTPKTYFPTKREADHWAEWGHACFAGHRIYVLPVRGASHE